MPVDGVREQPQSAQQASQAQKTETVAITSGSLDSHDRAHTFRQWKELELVDESNGGRTHDTHLQEQLALIREEKRCVRRWADLAAAEREILEDMRVLRGSI